MTGFLNFLGIFFYEHKFKVKITYLLIFQQLVKKISLKSSSQCVLQRTPKVQEPVLNKSLSAVEMIPDERFIKNQNPNVILIC